MSAEGYGKCFRNFRKLSKRLVGEEKEGVLEEENNIGKRRRKEIQPLESKKTREVKNGDLGCSY